MKIKGLFKSVPYEPCCICGEISGKHNIINAFVCDWCLEKAGKFAKSRRTFGEITAFTNQTKDMIEKQISDNQEFLNKQKEYKEIFNPTQIISNVSIDEQHKLFTFYSFWQQNHDIFSINDIRSVEVIENGETIISGNTGRAITGGILFGSTGAIIGSLTGKKKSFQECTEIKLRIKLNHCYSPFLDIIMLSKKCSKNSLTYEQTEKDIENILYVIDSCINDETLTADKEMKTTNLADELSKLKKLKDDGVLTDEEFIMAKQKIIGN